MGAWIAPALISTAGALIGGNQANKASKAAQKSADQAAQLQWQMFQQTRADQAPGRAIGNAALNMLGETAGLGTYGPDQAAADAAQANTPEGGGPVDPSTLVATGRKSDGGRNIMVDPNTGWGYVIAQKGSNAGSPVPIGSKIPGYPLTDKSAAGLAAVAAKAGAPTLKYFQASPDYQFRLNQGVTALDRSAAARGMVLSGAQNKALTQFGQDTGASEFGNWWNRIAGIAGVGQSAANNGAATAASFSNTIGNTVQNAGDARASGYLANANLIGGGANTLAQIVSQYYNPQPKLPAPSYPTTWRNPA